MERDSSDGKWHEESFDAAALLLQQVLAVQLCMALDMSSRSLRWLLRVARLAC